jgi:hypothetical protein
MISFRRSIFAPAILACLPALATAQVPALDQGSLMVGGSAFVGSQSHGDDERTTTISLAPALQFFVIPGLAVGGDLRYTRSSRDEFTSSSYVIGPAATYYFVRDGAAIQPFVTASVGFGSSSIEGFQDSESSVTAYQGGAGVLFLLNEAVGLDVQAFYLSESLEAGGAEQDEDRFGLSIGFSTFLP